MWLFMELARPLRKLSVLRDGLAIFSMFFGAGNVTFPLIVGQVVQGDVLYALAGLLLTAICIPFSGLISIALFDGDYEAFFTRIGKVPGLALVAILMSLIGPFGGIPRCIVLTHSTLSVHACKIPLPIFIAGAALILFVLSWKKKHIVEVIGFFLTPVLVVTLSFIILKGVFFSPHSLLVHKHAASPFVYALRTGYNTMDLMAAFFFSALVCEKFKKRQIDPGSRLRAIVFACLIGAALLAVIYVGFVYLGALYSNQLQDVGRDKMLGLIGYLVLGPSAGFATAVAISFACLTTAIALCAVVATFLQKQVFKGRRSYTTCLAIVLVLSSFCSLLGFEGIVNLLAPLLEIGYPALLVLCFVNIGYKLYAFRLIKWPVYSTLAFFFLTKVFRT